MCTSVSNADSLNTDPAFYLYYKSDPDTLTWFGSAFIKSGSGKPYRYRTYSPHQCAWIRWAVHTCTSLFNPDSFNPYQEKPYRYRYQLASSVFMDSQIRTFLYGYCGLVCLDPQIGTVPTSVADQDRNPDPDPPDRHVFAPPGSGSGSTSQWYGTGSGSCSVSGSGSFYYYAKTVRNTLIPTILWLFLVLSLNNDENVPSKSNK